MWIKDATLEDYTNFYSDKYIQVNDCGFQRTTGDVTQFRRCGRLDYQLILVSHAPFRALHNGAFYDLEEGDFLIYAPHEEQEYTFSDGTEMMWCHFTGSSIEGILEEAGFKSGVYRSEQDRRVIEAFYNIIRLYSTNSPDIDKNAAFLTLISTLSRNVKKELSDSHLVPVINYINKMYNKDISLATLAGISGYSKSRFSHIFSNLYKTTPLKYQNSIRLKIAREMLETTSLSITQISDACGYSNPLYFSRVFKREFSLSPENYRKSLFYTEGEKNGE